MTAEQIKTKLEGMVKHRFMYNGEEILIKSFQINNSVIRLLTSSTDIVIFKEDVEMLNTDFKPVESTNTTLSIQEPENSEKSLKSPNLVSQTVVGSRSADLLAVMMDNIDKIKKDPNYIAQADAINNQVKSIIDLAKTEVEMYRTLLKS